MTKTYFENIKLTAIRNKIFASLSDKKQVNIFDVITLSSGDYLPTQKMIDGKHTVYGGGGITSKNHNAFNIELETLGIGRVGARCGCVFKIKPQSWITDNALFASKIDKAFDLEFLIHFLNFKNLNQYANTAAQPVISLKRISGISIPKIDIKLQREIVAILNNVEKGDIEIANDEYGIADTLKFISSKESLDTELTDQHELLKQLCQSFLREAMQGKLIKQDKKDGNATDLLKKIKAEKEKLIAEKKLRKEKELAPIKEEEIPFDIPENWVWCNLGVIGICQTGTTPSTTVKNYFGKDIPFIKPADITLKGLITDNEGLSFLGLKEGVLIPNNSLMMVCIGGSIGKSYYTDFNVSCNQQINTITPLAEITAQFLQYFLQSDYFQKAIWAKASGGTTPIVNRSKWESILIPLPPLGEQKRIVNKLEKLMNLCAELKTTITDNQNYTDQLLQVALKDALQMKEVEAV